MAEITAPVTTFVFYVSLSVAAFTILWTILVDKAFSGGRRSRRVTRRPK